MKKRLLNLFYCLALLFMTGFALPHSTRAQSQNPISVPPYQLFRFRISNSNLGYLLTPSWNEGINHGYFFEAIFSNEGGTAGIYPVPAPGYTPDPASGLVPLHRWTVIEHGRAYTYYSTYYANYGSNYHYDYIQGYVFPAGQTSHRFPNGFVTHLSQMSSFYSQSFGYWNGNGAIGFQDYFEPPPNSSFTYQGDIFSLPQAGASTYNGCNNCVSSHAADVLFYPPSPPPPPPPPPSCDPNDQQYCANSGGSWDSSSCSCSYDPPNEFLPY